MINYKLMKMSGEVVVVCKELFQEATGFGDSKCRSIFMKRFKNDLLDGNAGVSSIFANSLKSF